VPGKQRRDQRQQRRKVGGEVHVHVRHHLGGAGGPDLAQRAAAAFGVEVHDPDVGQLASQV
jgi:hypothetical protein